MRITDTSLYKFPQKSVQIDYLQHFIWIIILIFICFWQEHFAVGSFRTVPINKAQYKMHLWYTLVNILMSYSYDILLSR